MHEPVVTPEGWVDCSCGWTSNHNRLRSADEQKMTDAAVAFDAEVIPPRPFEPYHFPGMIPTDQEAAEFRAVSDWERLYGGRVRPPEPADHTGEPDPLHLGPAQWETHVVAVERDAKIAEHFANGGTHFDLPSEVALLGVEQLVD